MGPSISSFWLEHSEKWNVVTKLWEVEEQTYFLGVKGCTVFWTC